MRNRVLIISAALLAGTVMAFGQGAMDRQNQGGSQPGASQGQPAQAQPKGAQQEQQPKGKQSQGQAQPKEQSRPSTTGQTPRGEEPNRAQGQNQREQPAQQQGQSPRTQERTQGQNQREQPAQNQREQPAQQGQQRQQQGQPAQQQGQPAQQQGQREGGGGTSVTLTTEQRTTIRETVLRGSNAPRVTSVNFTVREGTVIPRTVRIVDVPETLIVIHPQWRGFKYFVYNDEIIIVDASTLRIVAIIEV